MCKLRKWLNYNPVEEKIKNRTQRVVLLAVEEIDGTIRELRGAGDL